ncbi:MAG: transposase, partial [Terriglobia bacterium]
MGAIPLAQERRQGAHAARCTDSISTSAYVTEGQVHDVKLLGQLLPDLGAFYLLDRGYLDFARPCVFTQALAFFVTRAQENTQFNRRESRPIDKAARLISGQMISLTGPKTAQCYPVPLRLIFLTNNFHLPALTIAQRCRARWHVELFYRWIKQNPRINA